MHRICAYSTCDEAYLPKCVVSLLSIRKWNPDLDLFVISRTLSPDAKDFVRRHGIQPVEVDLQPVFHTSFEYPTECFYLFAGPGHFADLGYDFSVYVDGDVYCNQSLSIDWSRLAYFGGASLGRIRDILGSDLTAITAQWETGDASSYRIQSGVVYFNNRALQAAEFLTKISLLYETCIRKGIPRHGDDSLFALFQHVHPEFTPTLLDERFNYIISKPVTRTRRSVWLRNAEQRIRDCVFFHFTCESPKPWSLPNDFPCYTAKYFHRKWLQRMFDSLSDDERRAYFPEHHVKLADEHPRFYWWGSHNVGDLLTPYYLRTVCQIANPEQLRIGEDQIPQDPKYRSKIWGSLSKVLRRLGSAETRKRYRANSGSAPKPSYCISAGSIMRLCSEHAVVYGSGIRSRNQPVHPGSIRFVRGPLTRNRLLERGCECPPIYGDPGLLMKFHYQPTYRLDRKPLAIVPHFTEYERVRELYEDEPDVRVIDMGCGDLEQVIEQLVTASMAVSSSLHGIVFSNSYGIPVRWIKFSNQVYGDDTKFRDHFASIGRPDEECIGAIEFVKIGVDDLCQLITPYELQIDLSRTQDEMFFDESGIRTSARYPF